VKTNAEFAEAMASVQNRLLIQLATKMFVTSTRKKKTNKILQSATVVYVM
jgi:hypothetical protein